jgi:hypothetical protein
VLDRRQRLCEGVGVTSTRPAARAATALAATLVIVALIAAPFVAYAARVSHQDPSKDVLKSTTDPTDPPTAAAPHNKRADITDLTVDYTRPTLIVKLRLRELSRTGDSWIYGKIRTKPGRVLRYQRADRAPAVTLIEDSSALACDGTTARNNYSRDTVTLTIPASCLGGPRWVRVGAGYTWSPGGTPVYADDARRTGSYDYPSLGMGPRIKRG